MSSLEQIQQQVERILPANRFTHTLGVYETALILASRFGVNKDKAGCAALLHDVAKYLPQDEMKQLLIENNQTSYLNHSHAVWHAPVGRHIANKDFKINDEDILDAIQYHTTGRSGMSELEKVIFLADYIEPNRKQPGVDEIRDLCETSLDVAMAKTLDNTIKYLNTQVNPDIHPDTLNAYQDFKKFL